MLYYVQNLTLNIRDCVSLVRVVAQRLELRLETWASSFTPHCLCLSDDTLKADGPFYLEYITKNL